MKLEELGLVILCDILLIKNTKVFAGNCIGMSNIDLLSRGRVTNIYYDVSAVLGGNRGISINSYIEDSI